MDNLRTGEKIAGVSGVALFVLMFLSWFGIDRESAQDLSVDDLADAAEAFAGEAGSGENFSVNAWEAFGFIDIILLLAVIAGVGLAVISVMSTQVNLPVAMSALAAGLGGLGTLLILYRIIDTPYGFGREFWVFLGLIAAAGITYGGWMAMQEEGASFSGEADRVGGTGGEAPPPPPPPPPSSTGPAA